MCSQIFHKGPIHIKRKLERKRKRSKNKKTSEKIFAFAFAFAQSKHGFEANSVNKDNGFRIRFTLSVKESPETRTIYFNVFKLLTDDYLRWLFVSTVRLYRELWRDTNVSSALTDSTSQRLSVSHRADSNHGTEYIAIFTARKRRLGQGNVFTPVCDSVHGGVSAPLDASINPPAHTHPWAHPPGHIHPPGHTPPWTHTHPGWTHTQTPPSPRDTKGYGQKAGGRNTTGMHTCFNF